MVRQLALTSGASKDGTLHFGIRPSAVYWRILGQDGSVQTPAVHLGHIEGDS